MEWTVVCVLIAIVGLLATLIKPIIRINTSAVELTAAVKNLKKSVADISADNKEEHNELWQAVEVHDDRLNDHDTRLALIEHKAPGVDPAPPVGGPFRRI